MFALKCPILPDFEYAPSTTSLFIIKDAPRTVEECNSKTLFNLFAHPIDVSANIRELGIFSINVGNER